MQSSRKSIFTYAAESGVGAGVGMSLMAVCLFLSMKAPWLSTAILLLGAGVIVFISIGMRRICRRDAGCRTVSALWLYGIYTTIFGTLIAALFSTVWLIFIDPAFLYTYFQWAYGQLSATGSSPAEQEIFRKAIEAKLYPSTSTFVSTMMWLTASFGSLLSLPFAALNLRYEAGRRKRLSDSSNI